MALFAKTTQFIIRTWKLETLVWEYDFISDYCFLFGKKNWWLLVFTDLFHRWFAGNLYCIYYLSGSENYLIGASGAVSGILGAWIVLFPSLKISIIIPIGFYMQKAEIPVLLLSLIWLGIQIILQLVSPLDYSIVWISHVVGFITGFCLAWLYRIAN